MTNENSKLDSERAAFEAAFDGEFFSSCFEREDDGTYAGRGLQGAWMGWQKARASLPVGVPDVLFDGYAVLGALSGEAEARTSAENVSDVLDAVVKLLRAEAAAPTVKAEQVPCATCQGSSMVDDGEITCFEGGIPYENGPVKCVKDCPDCTVRSPSLPAAGSAVEEVEVVAYLGDGGTLYPNKKSVDKYLPVGRTAEPLMTVAQHQRIVAALSAQQSAPERVSVPDGLAAPPWRTRKCNQSSPTYAECLGGKPSFKPVYIEPVGLLVGQTELDWPLADFIVACVNAVAGVPGAAEQGTDAKELSDAIGRVLDGLGAEVAALNQLRALLASHGRGEA